MSKTDYFRQPKLCVLWLGFTMLTFTFLMLSMNMIFH